MNSKHNGLTRRGLRPYEQLVLDHEAGQADIAKIPSISVVVCPEPECSRTATIEVDVNGEEVIRYHRTGKTDALTSYLLDLGFAEPVRCPHHQIDEKKAKQRLKKMFVELDLNDHRTSAEILDSLLMSDFGQSLGETGISGSEKS